MTPLSPVLSDARFLLDFLKGGDLKILIFFDEEFQHFCTQNAVAAENPIKNRDRKGPDETSNVAQKHLFLTRAASLFEGCFGG
jgi:hypothetical protein